MNEGSEHGCVIWENQGWLISNSHNLGGTIEKSVGNKSSNPSSSNSQPQAAAKKRKAAASGNRTKDGSNGNDEEKCGGGGVEGESDHEIHILTERERRKKMRNMFSNLHALLPQLPPKADKSTIVDEAVNYIKTLENTLQKLQKKKLERLHGMAAAIINYDPSIIASQKLLGSDMSSFETFLADQGSTSNSAAITPTNKTSASPPLIPGLIPAVFQTWTSPNVILNVCGDEAQISICCLKKHGLLSSICYVLEKYKIEMVSAQVSSDHYRSMFMIQTHASGGGSSDQYSETLTVEEIYKRAAGEIMLWATSK